jgi:hypothetical protein
MLCTAVGFANPRRAHAQLLLVLFVAGLLCALGHRAAAQELPKEGIFAHGIGAIPLSFGPVQVFSKEGHASGLRVSAGVQLDLGPRWALRLPLVLAAADGTNGGYAEIDLSPGMLYRFRYRADQTVVPYFGAAAKLGGFGADREFLGKPLLPVTVHATDLFHEHHHGSSDPNFDTVFSVAGEAWLGASVHASRLFSVDFDVAGEALPIDGVLVGALTETMALRFTF